MCIHILPCTNSIFTTNLCIFSTCIFIYIYSSRPVYKGEQKFPEVYRHYFTHIHISIIFNYQINMNLYVMCSIPYKIPATKCFHQPILRYVDCQTFLIALSSLNYQVFGLFYSKEVPLKCWMIGIWNTKIFAAKNDWHRWLHEDYTKWRTNLTDPTPHRHIAKQAHMWGVYYGISVLIQ